MFQYLRNGFKLYALIIAILFLILPSYSFEIPLAFSKDTAGLENLSSEQLIDLYNNSSDLANIPPMIKNSTIRKQYMPIFADKIRQDDITVKRIANEIVKGHTGELTLDQIFTIYDYLRYGRNGIGGWYYVSDQPTMANESDKYSSASETLMLGERMNFTGSGDCDDFAIVMASLVNAIGGTVRVVAVEDNGKLVHAYCEVYLGCLNETDDDIYYLAQLIRTKYRVDKIYTHIDPSSKDVWLNLDTPLNLGDRAYPGIPYSPGSSHYLIVDLPVNPRIIDLPISPSNEIKPPEYRSMLNIVKESMNSPEAMDNLGKIDENMLLFKLLAERNGLNASEVPSTNELLDATYNMLGSYGMFDLDMAKLAYGNTSFIPNSSADSLYLVIDLKKMLNDPAMMQGSNASNSMFGANPFSNLGAIMNNSMIVQDGKDVPLSAFYESLGLKIK